MASEKNITAMQELIDYLEKYREVIGITAVMTIDKAKILLEKEKKQIIHAYIFGDGDAYNDTSDYAERYYNETYPK